jgi:hypothetical protein
MSSNTPASPPPLSTTTTTHRSATAVASANARERRKRELDALKAENEKLKLERDRYLQHIDELQAKVNEMREKDGELDVQLENELLKAQLKEHATFVEALIHQAKFGPPAITLSPEHDKIKLYRQGADFAVQQVLSLLTRSVKQSSEWTLGRFNRKISAPFAVSYQIIPDFIKTSETRLNLRTDLVFEAKPEQVLAQYMNLWTNDEMLKTFFRGSNFRPSSDLTQITHNVTLLNDSLTTNGETLGALHTREETGTKGIDMLFAFSKKKVDVAYGTLVGTSLHCSLLEPWKRESVLLLARSSQKHDETTNSNYSLWVEGCIAWEQEPGLCRMTTIVSVPENWVLFAKAIVFDEFIHNGVVNDKFLELTERFMESMKGSSVTSSSSSSSSSNYNMGGRSSYSNNSSSSSGTNNSSSNNYNNDGNIKKLKQSE